MAYTSAIISGTGPCRVMEKGMPRYLFPMHRNPRRNDPRGSRDHLYRERWLGLLRPT